MPGIEGLKFSVAGEELTKHCKERARFHEGRAKFYSKQGKKFRVDASEELERDHGYSNKTVMQQANNIDDYRKMHERRARFYAWASDHFEHGVIYMLSQSDLGTIGFETLNG